MVEIGMIEIGYTLLFQVLNTVLLLLIFIGLPIYLIKRHKKINRLETKLRQVEERLKAIEDQE